MSGSSEIERLKARIAELEADREAFRRSVFEDWLSRRDVTVEDACPRCGGFGVVFYGSTATWRGGIGGQAITADACDKCWGSGKKSRPWPSHRTWEHLAARAKKQA